MAPAGANGKRPIRKGVTNKGNTYYYQKTHLIIPIIYKSIKKKVTSDIMLEFAAYKEDHAQEG